MEVPLAEARPTDAPCQEIGLNPDTVNKFIGDPLPPGRQQAEHHQTSPEQHVQTVPSGVGEGGTESVTALHEEVQRLRAENQKLIDRQRQVMELINARSPEKLVHDVRNVLNQLALLQALMDADEK